jgi:hypothetical protein
MNSAIPQLSALNKVDPGAPGGWLSGNEAGGLFG